MNIGKLNWVRLEISHQELSERNNFCGKLNEPKLKITGGKTAKETLGCSVSISKESEDMLKQLNEEKKQKEDDLTSESQSPTIDLNNSIMIEAESVYDTNRQRLYDAVRNSNVEDFYTGPTYNFGRLSSTYEKLRIETETQYTGEELEVELRRLEADYEYILADTKEKAETAVRFWAKQGKEEEKTAIKLLFGIERNDILDMVGIGKDKSFVNSIDTIIQFLLKNAGETNEIQT